MSVDEELVNAPRKRLRPRTIVAAVIAVLAVAAGLTVLLVRHFQDEGYGPIVAGPTGGIVGSDLRNTVTEDQVVRMRGSVGTEVRVVHSIGNDGSHDVTVTGVDRNGFVTDVRWARSKDSVVGISDASQLLTFPATVPAHGWIYIVTTVRKPRCARGEPRGTVIGPTLDLRVHWTSPSGGHRTDVESTDVPFSVC